MDIREEIAGIRALTKNATAESFGADWAMKRAVQHALLIIAEAASEKSHGKEKPAHRFQLRELAR
jgi:uncharacterized protein with HEPN domain